MEFFLKKHMGKDGVARARVFVEHEGFIGLASENHKQVKPHLFTAFQDFLKEKGMEKAKAECLEMGECRMPKEPRNPEVIEREIIEVEGKSVMLKEELKRANEKAKEAAKAKAPAKKTIKEAVKAKIEEVKSE